MRFLLRIGFTRLPVLPQAPVVSYTTLSPLPAKGSDLNDNALALSLRV